MKGIDLITLMSDGAMSFVASIGARGLATDFMMPVSKFLWDHDSETGNTALSQTLDNPQTYTITGDDKTLL